MANSEGCTKQSESKILKGDKTSHKPFTLTNVLSERLHILFDRLDLPLDYELS